MSKTLTTLLTAALLLGSCGAMAGQYPVAEYRDDWLPPGCKKGRFPCRNPANVQANAFFTAGKFKDILPLCDKINHAHEPKITMPDMYLICAKSGNVRKMGQMAWYYHNVDYQPDLAYYWAREGSVRGHPDSQLAWREMCAAERWGVGTQKDIRQAMIACSIAAGITNNHPDPVAKKWYDEMSEDFYGGRDLGASAEGFRELREHQLLERARNNFR